MLQFTDKENAKWHAVFLPLAITPSFSADQNKYNWKELKGWQNGYNFQVVRLPTPFLQTCHTKLFTVPQ